MIDADQARHQERMSTRLRQKGDALRQGGNVEEARQVYEGAVAAVDLALIALGDEAPAGGGSDDDTDIAKIADLLGVRGGLLRRLDRLDEALASYRRGADLERQFGLTASYNRTNAVKLALLLGALTLADAQPALTELRDAFEARLTSDEQAADDAWLWADLADCRLLLGQERAAEDAYRQFAQKAETRSPATTLAVLDELATSLSARGDPLAPGLVEGVSRIRAALEAWSG